MASSRRARVGVARTNKRTLRFTDAELADLANAAARVGLATDAYTAEAAVRTARTTARLPADWRDALAAVLAATEQVRRAGQVANQLARVANSTGQLPGHAEDVLARLDRATAHLDALAARVYQRLP